MLYVCVCVCVCVCVHAHVSVMSVLRVCIQVCVWFNMTCDCFSSPLLSFPLYWHHLQIVIIILFHLGNWEWWTVWWTLLRWNLVRFEVHSLTALFLRVFWYVTVNIYGCFRAAYFLHLLGMLDLEAAVTAVLHNKSKYLAFDMAQHPRRLETFEV